MKNIAILGSTGSIGTQTLNIVRRSRELNVVALSCGKNIELLERQIREFEPRLVSVETEELANDLKNRIKDLNVKVSFGLDGLSEIATIKESEILVTAIVGMLGLIPTIEAIKAGKKIALANKETLVTAGHIIMPLARELKVPILPVDSEHSAIFQSIQGISGNKIEKILLTASGGPFRGKTLKDLNNVSVKDALKHPNWTMGKKITIDSATMVNKGLEVMEAKWLFDVNVDNVEVLVHPQSILHSAVQFEDGAVIGQLGVPDMELPIQYALFYPERRSGSVERLDLFKINQLTFEKPDLKTFYGLRLAYQAMYMGGNAATIYNAANESAVNLFLNEKIRFIEIPEIIQGALENVKVNKALTIDEILDTKSETEEYIKLRWM
ncbi:MAG: 1-deoxy-D-xylulose-5-phosphate reductoisomerase [Lachnospiraceae bacterium]|nr:1-deoxy-D-xylulose-5-phosphate reductoisomerase [Lachnospiraceae bacterium]